MTTRRCLALLSIVALIVVFSAPPAEAQRRDRRPRAEERSANHKDSVHKTRRGKKGARAASPSRPTAAVDNARTRRIEAALDALLAVAVQKSAERPPRTPAEEAVRSLRALESIVDNATTPTIAEAVPALCRPTAIGLCLYGRFIVAGVWENPYLAPGVQNVMGAIQLTGQSGYMWFLSPGNMEVPIKLVDFCAVGRGVGVFAAGLSDFGVSLGVRDMVTGIQVNYINPPKSTFNTIIDQNTPWPCIF